MCHAEPSVAKRRDSNKVGFDGHKASAGGELTGAARRRLGYILSMLPMRFLPTFLIAAALACAAVPAPAQSLFIDVNGDGRGDAGDVLTPAVTSVDIYLDTTHDAAGGAASCNEALSVCSYTFILEWEPGRDGTLAYRAWSDNMGFTVRAGGGQGGRMFWIGRAAPYFLAPGRYMLGTLEVQVTGTPILRFLASTPLDNLALTTFGSMCGGRDFDNTMKLGSDFVDARGTSPADTSPRTAWRTLRDLYR